MAFMTWVVCHFSACMGLVFSILFSDLVMLAKRASYVLLNQYMISVLPFLFSLIRYRSKIVFSVLLWGI